jgi:hypothetical protein
MNGANPVNGYGLRLTGLALNGASGTTTLTANLGSPGAAFFATPTVGGSVAGGLVIDTITTAGNSNSGLQTLTISDSGYCGSAAYIPGDIVQTAAAPLALNLTDVGFITLGSSSMTSATNYSGGLTINNGNLTVRAVSPYSLGAATNPITITSGTLELRSDTGNLYSNPVTWGANSSSITLGEAVNGSSGLNQTFALGGITVAGTTTGRTLTISGISGSNNASGDSLNLGGITFNTTTALNDLLNNSLPLPGVVNVGNVTIAGAGSANEVLTLNGAGVSEVGNVTNGTATMGVKVTTGVVDFSQATSGNSYTGGLTLTGGTLRVTNQYGLGLNTPAGSGGTMATNNVVTLGGGSLELRSDAGGATSTFNNQFQISASTALDVGQLPGGTGVNGATGVTFNLGQLKTTTTGPTLTVAGIGGSLATSEDNVTFTGGVDLNGLAATTITNNLPLPGLLSLGNVVSSTTSTTTAVLTLNGSGVTQVGNVANGSNNVVQVVSSPTGIVDFSAATSGNTYTGGLKTTAGTTRVTNQYGLGANTGTMATSNVVTLAGGTLELRGDATGAATTFSNQILLSSSTSLNVGQLPGGTGNNGATGVTFSLGQFKTGLTGYTLTVGGIGGSTASSADSVTFTGGVDLNGLAATTVTNNLPLPGMLNLGNVTSNAASANPVLTINGTGTTTLGDITNGAATGNGLAITYSGIGGSGILDLSRATATTFNAGGFTGGLTINSGTVRVANQYGLGPAANILTLGTGTLEIRTDSNVTYNNPLYVAGAGAVLSVGQLPGGTGTTGGYANLITMGQVTPSATGKILTIAGIGGTSGTNSSYTLASEGYSVALQGVNIGGVVAPVVNETLTITNSLLFTSANTGLLTISNVTNTGTLGTSGTPSVDVLTFNGAGTTTITGDITDSTTAYNKTGITNSAGFLNLAGTSATNYSGGFKITGGTVRATTQYSLGIGTITLGGGTLEIRNDSNVSYGNAVSLSASTTVALGQLPGGTGATGGYNNTVTLGPLTPTATGYTLTAAGIGGTSASDGYNLTLGAVTSNVAALSIISNMPLPSVLTIPSVTNGGSTNSVLTLGGATAGGFINITGDITNGGGSGTLGITANGAAGSLLVLAGTSATNYTGGLNNTGGGTLRTTTPYSFGASSNLVALTNGTLDVRYDGNLTIPNAVTVNSNNVTINADQLTTGNLSKTVTFNGTATSLGATAKTLTLTSGSNYGISFTNGFSDAITGWTITNSASGTVNLGPINYTGATGGSLTINGAGYTTVGNITTNPPLATNLALTYSGTGFLDLTGNNGATGPMSAITLSGTGGITKVNTPTNLGAANATINMNGGTLQVRSNGSGNNGTISFGNPVVFLGSAANVFDLGNNGGGTTGNTVAFGSYSISGATATTLTLNGANGYGASFTSLALPSSGGQTTNLVPNAPLTIAGNVTNQMSGFTSGNYDTLVLDGVAGGAINGTIADATGASLSAGGLTHLTKQNTDTWVLNPGGTGNSYLGVTTVTNGTLKSGANNAISSANGSGLSITAQAGVTAIVDLAGFNQTLGEGTGAASGILNDALQMGGGSATSQSILTNSTGTSTLTLAGTTGSNGDVYYTGSTNNPLRSIIGVTNLNYGGAARTFNVIASTNDTVGLQITSAINDGGFGTTKTGSGDLLFSGNLASMTGPISIAAGTLSTTTAIVDASTLSLGLTTTAGTLQYVGSSGGETFNSRTVTLSGTTAGGTIDSSGVTTGSNAVVITPNLAFANGTANKTLTLTGTNADANAMNGVISNEGSYLTAVTKSGTGTWTLGNVNTNQGLYTVTAGTLKLGVANALCSNGQGINLTAAAGTASVPVVATIDLAGHNETFGVGTVTGAQTSALILGGGSVYSTPQVIDSVGGGTLTLAGTSTTGDVQYVNTNNPVGGLISATTLDLGSANRTFNVGDSTNAATDLLVTSAIQNGTLTKSGVGTMAITGPVNFLNGASGSTLTIAATSGSLIVTNPISMTTGPNLDEQRAGQHRLRRLGHYRQCDHGGIRRLDGRRHRRSSIGEHGRRQSQYHDHDQRHRRRVGRLEPRRRRRHRHGQFDQCHPRHGRQLPGLLRHHQS